MAKAGGYTGLMEAARSQDTKRVRELLEAGEDPNLTDRFGVTALQLAARWSYRDEAVGVELVMALLDAGADINAAERTQGLTPLMHAVICGVAPVVKLLIERGADVNRKGKDGNTALGIIASTPAIAKRRKRIATLLEKAGGQ